MPVGLADLPPDLLGVIGEFAIHDIGAFRSTCRRVFAALTPLWLKHSCLDISNPEVFHGLIGLITTDPGLCRCVRTVRFFNEHPVHEKKTEGEWRDILSHLDARYDDQITLAGHLARALGSADQLGDDGFLARVYLISRHLPELRSLKLQPRQTSLPDWWLEALNGPETSPEGSGRLVLSLAAPNLWRLVNLSEYGYAFALPHIQSIDIDTTNLRGDPGLVTNSSSGFGEPIGPSSLRHLRLTTTGDGGEVRRAIRSCPRLESLDVLVAGMNIDFRQLQEDLLRCADTLVQLDLEHVSRECDKVLHWEPTRHSEWLPHMKKLQHVNIPVKLLNWHCYGFSLRSVLPPKLTTLRLQCFDEWNRIIFTNSPEIVRALAVESLAFPTSLREVRIRTGPNQVGLFTTLRADFAAVGIQYEAYGW